MEVFAATLVPAKHKNDKRLLRDHAKQMLETIAADLASPETADEQDEKAKGKLATEAPTTAAGTHGAERLDLGFSLDAAMAEYRTLRASVTRLWHMSPSGNSQFYEYIFAPVLDENNEVVAVAGTAHNITERKAAEDKNWHNANYDVLTGLPKRRLFPDRLAPEIMHAGRTVAPIALMLIDLDHFKAVNDKFGHEGTIYC